MWFGFVTLLPRRARDAAKPAIRPIRQGIKTLGSHPEIGRPIDDLPPEFREWILDFGGAAYVAPYRYDGKEVVILALRHEREAGC